MTSHYRHRRIINPAATFPTPIEPGEIMVNSANRQLALGDADPASPGVTKPLIGVRFFDAKAQYGAGEFVVQGGVLYRSKAVILPGAFNAAQWEPYVSDTTAKAYIDAADAAITTAFQNADAAIVTAYQAADTALTSSVNNKVNKAGDTMAGPLQLAGAPRTDLEAANKKYVDETVATGGSTPRADQIITVPSGNLQTGNVQLQLYELDLEKAPLASAQLTGNPRAPTPPVNDNSISIATTAFVAGQASTIAPLVDGAGLPGSSLKYAREDHVHPSDATRAPIDSPAFTGTPNAPTPPPGDNDTTLATTAFVAQAMVGISGFSTGDVKLTFKSIADASWVMMNDGTIGDAASGASTRAGADCHALFILLWDSIADTYCPVVGGRGGSSAADWSAHKKLTLPRALGRALAVAGSGSGLSGRALGQFAGEENHTLIPNEQASMGVSVNVNVSGSTGSVVTDVTSNNANVMNSEAQGQVVGSLTVSKGAVTISASGSGSGTANGGGQAHNNVQPSSFMNVMVKL
jgi:microcystin-dependent protein